MKTNFQVAGKATWMAVAAVCMAFAPEANACGTPAKGAGVKMSRAWALMAGPRLVMPRPEAAAPGNQAADSTPTVVGMWELTMTSGGAVFDHAFQQFYIDGNEMQNSGLSFPAEGNVCYGVWVQQDARTFKLKHYAWLYDTSGNGTFTGTYVMTATITVGTPAGSDTYFGNFVADTVLPSGMIDPTQHAEGTMSAKRIKID